MTDLDYIQLSLQLAAQGKGLVSPNPLVGSLVVRDGEVVGRGLHRYDEVKHAEVWALEEAGARARGATVYVNLEPCSHRGNGKRTPPCAQALVDAGVARVVASMVDPNPQVNGRGFETLRAAGIEVEVGLMEREARRLNEKYVKAVTTGRPFVHLKAACSLDGRIATRAGESKWITGAEARETSQLLRHEYDAILVGVGTVLADAPLLTDRTGKPRRRPLARVVLDAGLRTPPDSPLVATAREWPLIIFAAPKNTDRRVYSVTSAGYESNFDSDAAREEVLTGLGAEVVRVESHGGRLDLPGVLAELARRQLTSVIVEGGAETAASFVEQRLVDKVTFFVAPLLVGGREALPVVGGRGVERLADALRLGDVEVTRRGEDLEVTGYPAPVGG
jgi:diaminohydroxyphosphoribosylaminopyrimidine deaminase / 5-amino-6-(5-phosphoribosylamino)uracil reductase